MPDDRADWARAMLAEAGYIHPARAALTFAAGCLRAALFERLADALRKSTARTAGVATGFVFFAHAAMPDSRAWPLVWPLMGGFCAVLVWSRNAAPMAPLHGAWLGLRTGAASGVLFVAAGALLVSAASDLTLASRLPAIATAGVLGLVLATAGGGAAALVARRS